MAEFMPPVIFEIKAKATEAIASFKEVNRELAVMEKNGLIAGGALGKLDKAAKYSRTALLGLAGAFGVVGVTSVMALDKVEKAQANLETAIKNTGVSFEAAKPAVDAHAQAMKNLGFTYDETYGALSKMTAASGSPKLALDALSTAADLARFKQISLADAGTLLARASIGQAKGLGDLGIAMGKTIPKGASFAQILKMVEDKAGGAANAFKNTLSGGIAVARANFQDLQVQIGTDLVPALIQVTDWITKTGIPKLKDLAGFVKDNFGWFKALAGILATIWAVGKLSAFISMIGKLIAVMRTLAVVSGVAAVAEAFATGGLSVGAAALAIAGTLTPALAAGAAIYGGVKLYDIFGGNQQSGGMPKGSLPKGGGGTLKVNSDLTGKGVKRIDTPKSSAASAITQNITMNIRANSPTELSNQMSKLAKNGTPMGGR